MGANGRAYWTQVQIRLEILLDRTHMGLSRANTTILIEASQKLIIISSILMTSLFLFLMPTPN